MEIMGNKNPKNRITKENRASLNPRGKAKKTLIINALKESSLTEHDFWCKVVDKALNGGADGDGDTQMMTLIAKKLFPDTKATLETYEIELKDGEKRLDRAEAITLAALNGNIPIDVGKLFLESLASVAKIEEVDNILDRLDKIEEHLS